MKTTILTKKTGAGNFQVTVFENHNELGTFETTDMQLIDDIEEMRNGGFESELMMHETFEEVIETCLNKIEKYVIVDGSCEFFKYYSENESRFGGDLSTATTFKTEEEAEQIIVDNEWSKWAYVQNL